MLGKKKRNSFLSFAPYIFPCTDLLLTDKRKKGNLGQKVQKEAVKAPGRGQWDKRSIHYVYIQIPLQPGYLMLLTQVDSISKAFSPRQVTTTVFNTLTIICFLMPINNLNLVCRSSKYHAHRSRRERESKRNLHEDHQALRG